MAIIAVFAVFYAVLSFAPGIVPDAVGWLPDWALAGGGSIAVIAVWEIVKAIIGIGMFVAMFGLRTKLTVAAGGAGASAAAHWEAFSTWVSGLFG